jgi:ethanolamine utilization protein EutA
LAPGDAERLAARMADALFDAMNGGAPRIGTASRSTGLLRLDPLGSGLPVATVTFSGGVSEYVYGWETGHFGDLGNLLAAAIRNRVAAAGMQIAPPAQGIRATVIGASQYTSQVSGSTIFVSPLDVLPLRSLPVIAPAFALGGDTIDSAVVARAVRTALQRLDLVESESPVAVFAPWVGSATFHRLDAFCRGVVEGLGGLVARGLPVVLAGDGDVGGLLGIHFREELKVENPVISIDGLELKQFDFIDIGEMLESSGAVPVVIKSLIFPASAALGEEWKAAGTPPL